MSKIIRKNKIDFLVYREGKGGTAELFDIAVMSNRQVGIGRSLIEEMENRCRERGVSRIYAFVRVENGLARVFYKKMGFTEVFLDNFYPDGGAVIVTKII